jgi:uncharacterized protein YegP (UPF0339 family)
MQLPRILTADRYFILTYLFWMCGGCLLILPVIFTTMAGSELFSSRYDGFSEEFIRLALIPFVKQLSYLISTGVVAFVLFRLGQRNREVVLPGDGTVRIRWGSRFPVQLRRVDAAALQAFVVKKEERYALNARGNGQYGVRAMPDRWRVKATANGRTVNLGSYTTEAEAQAAVAAIQQI